jgi:hypothetical protein
VDDAMTGWWVAAFVVQWVLLIVLALVVVALARQIGTLHLRLGPRGALELDDEGPRLGEAPHPMPASSIDGSRITLGGPGAGRLVVFSSPTCAVCRELAPAIAPAATAGRLAPQVVHDSEAEREWNVPGTPYVVILDDLGMVRAKGTVNNLEQLEGLIDTADRRIEQESIASWAN